MGCNLIDLWVRIYNASPKLFIPGTKFDVCFTILSALSLSLVRALSSYIYIHVFHFDPTNRRTLEMAASTTSSLHSLLLVPVLWQLLRDQPFVPSAPIANAPQRYKDGVTAMLQLCTGYMIYDFIFMMKLEGWTIHADDMAFAAHHFVTIFVMSQTRFLGAGQVFTMNLMWSGEWTNPLQNLLYVTKYAIQMTPDDSFVHMIHPYVEMTYAVFYLFFRAIVGPALIFINTYDLLFTKEGRKNIPLKVSLLWCPMTAGIIIGSIPWTIEAYDMIMDGLGNVKYHKEFDYGPRFGGLMHKLCEWFGDGIKISLSRLIDLIFKRRNSTNIAPRYGKWCLLIVDDSKSIPLLKTFAQFLINLGMNIIILDNLPCTDNIQTEVHQDIESLVKDLTLYASANDVLSVETVLKVKIETLSDDYKNNELSKLKSRIGEIMIDGGLGVVLNFTSSLSVAESNAKKFLNVMETILPYYLFRRTGAVINVTDYRPNNGYENYRGGLSSWIQRGISRGVSGFATQLTRSIHFELIGYGVHCIAVTIDRNESISTDTIVKATFQSLGHEEELDMNFVRMARYIDMLI